MKGFILAHGYSGTTWIAHALTTCTDLDARHESMRHDLSAGFGGVESNGNFWKQAAEIRERYGCPAIHQVRDGRLVVRTHMSRKPQREFEHACQRWRVRNERLSEDVPAEHRFRLEDLTTDFGTFSDLAALVGATRIRRSAWERERSQPKNAYGGTHRIPAYHAWSDDMKATFWDICGPMMEECGYDGRPDAD